MAGEGEFFSGGVEGLGLEEPAGEVEGVGFGAAAFGVGGGGDVLGEEFWELAGQGLGEVGNCEG